MIEESVFMPDKVTGAEIIARSIAAQGVDKVFTVPTPRLRPLLDALESIQNMDVVEARNETAAACIADGYVRCSRRRAAVLTDGRGRALSQVCGVTNAWGDKIPLIALALCEDGLPDWNNGVNRHRFDQMSSFQPITRWRTRLQDPKSIPAVLERAARETASNRMGPVYVDIPVGLLNRRIQEAEWLPPAEINAVAGRPVEPARLSGDPEAVARAAGLIMEARCPLILYGAGVRASNAGTDLLEFMEKYHIPAAGTMAGLGCIPLSHPLSLGPPSYAGGEAFHVAIKKADVVIALGASFGGLEGFGLPPLWSGKTLFIHVDIDPLQIGLNTTPATPVQGDVKTVLRQLMHELDARNFTGHPRWEPWRTLLFNLREGRKKRLEKNADLKSQGIHQGKLCMEVSRIVSKEDVIMVIDGGNTPLYAAMYAPDVGPMQAVFPFGMAALGSGLAYAIGAQLANPDKRVVVATGDGSFLYNIQELETMRRLGMSVTVIINNDSAWNMIRALLQAGAAPSLLPTAVRL